MENKVTRLIEQALGFARGFLFLPPHRAEHPPDDQGQDEPGKQAAQQHQAKKHNRG